MKKVIRLTEEDLHNIIKESVNQILNENVNEGWKQWAMAGALGAASLFGGQSDANAQKYKYAEHPYINGKEVKDTKYSNHYDITYDNEETESKIYDLLRFNGAYRNIMEKNNGKLPQEILSKVVKYPKYDMSIPLEKFLKQNSNLIKRCGGQIGWGDNGEESSVCLLLIDNVYYLLPSYIEKL